MYPTCSKPVHACICLARCEASEESVLPELVELLNDEENRVRVCALESVVDQLSLWSEQCRRTQVLPLLRGFCETAGKSDDWTLVKGPAKLLGRLCYELKGRKDCTSMSTIRITDKASDPDRVDSLPIYNVQNALG